MHEGFIEHEVAWLAGAEAEQASRAQLRDDESLNPATASIHSNSHDSSHHSASRDSSRNTFPPRHSTRNVQNEKYMASGKLDAATAASLRLGASFHLSIANVCFDLAPTSDAHNEVSWFKVTSVFLCWRSGWCSAEER